MNSAAARRLAILFALALAPLALYLATLWRLQVIEVEQNRRAAESSAVREWVIPAPRGAVYDREGRPLSQNAPRVIVALDRDLWLRKTGNPERAAALAGAVSLGYPEELVKRQAAAIPTGPIILDRDAPHALTAYLLAHQGELPGLALSYDSRRIYPYGPLAAHAIGYLGAVTPQELDEDDRLRPGDQVGRGGIERAFESQLRGRYGVRQLWVDSRGREVKLAGFGTRTLRQPVPGKSLRLALDLRFQEAIERAFAGRFGAAVFLDPKSGEVYALLSQPAYDLNQLTGRIRPEVWQQLQAADGAPFVNRAVEAAYAPGSVWKTVMTLAALTHHAITPETTFFCPGKIKLYDRDWACTGHHGYVDLRRAVAQSCNVYFYNVSLKLGIERLEPYGRMLGIGQLTGISLPGENPGIMPGPQWKAAQYERLVARDPKFAQSRYRWLKEWFAGETLSVAIGQGQLQMTPVQVARLMALIASDGNLVVPQLATRIGDTVIPPSVSRLELDRDALKVLKEGLCRVTEPGGTAAAAAARAPGIKLCGKTGTAQLVSNETVMARGGRSGGTISGFRNNSWFAGYAPAEDPQVAFAVIVEQGGHGSEAAAPIAADAVKWWLTQRRRATPAELQPALQLAGDYAGGDLSVAPALAFSPDAPRPGFALRGGEADAAARPAGGAGREGAP